MNVVTINSRKQAARKPSIAFYALGFRPFFFFAASFAIVTVTYWSLIYSGIFTPHIERISIFQWHAHEMIYGYSVAVIAGFLLTAVNNWTGAKPLSGIRLALLTTFWCIARFLWLFGTRYLTLVTIFDLIFMLALIYSILAPIIQAKQWKQIGVASKVILLFIGNIVFYSGAFGYSDNWLFLSTHGGLLLIVALITTIATRVLPGFIRNSLNPELNNQSPRWIMPANLVLSLIFFINHLFFKNLFLESGCASFICIANTVNLYYWHNSGIWKNPLLWGLYLSVVSITFGFLLLALAPFINLQTNLALHAFAYGGIGLSTMSMMSRVALGHTGRSVQEPPNGTTYACSLLAIGFICRVIFPLFIDTYYHWLILLSQLAWVISFAIFLKIFTPILTKARIDGKIG